MNKFIAHFSSWFGNTSKLLLMMMMLFTTTSQAQYQTNGNAAQTACNCWQLTPAANSQNGSVWNVNLFDLSNPFNFTFDVYLGCNDGGADGMAFVLQPLSVNAGSFGGGIGYAGINPSLAVEMDTYTNATDPGADHMAFQTNGIVTHGGANNLAGPIQTSATSANVEDCAWHVLNITWDPTTMTLVAFFDGVQRLTYTGDIVNNLFGGNPNVYWGFTAATGGANNVHQFCNSLDPAFIITSPVQCQGFPVDFESASVVATGLITDYQWDFGDGNTATGTQVSHTYVGSGVFDVTLTITSEGCTETDMVQVTINPEPTIDLGTDQAVCPGDSYQMAPIGLVGGEQLAWNPPLGLDNPLISNPTATPATTTTYTLGVIDANGCANTDDIEIAINPVPVVDFDQPADACLGNPTVFVDNSTGNGLIHAWDFGDGSPIDNGISPNHTYVTDGTFTVTLNLTDANGCTASANDNATVLPLPAAAMNITDGQSFCEDEMIQFQSLSVGGTLDLFWDFGDNAFLPAFPNTTSTLPNPTMAYGNFAFGPYTVTLSVTDAAGCVDIAQSIVSIIDNPDADFSSTIVCEGNQTQFTDESSSFLSTVNNWAWNFGDGTSTSSDQNPTYLYPDSGTYSVQLEVTTNDGCTETITQNVLINPTPEIAFSGIDTCLNDETIFTNNSSPQNATVTVWDWDFGDGNTSNGVVSSHTYLDHGQFPVSLTATTDSGCVASGTIDIQVFPNPEPAFNVVESVGCAPHEVLFVDQSTIATGFLDTYIWDFGDGGTSTSGNPVYTFQDSGFYDITLSVTTAEGCNTVLQVDDAVKANVTPTADFSIKNEELSLLDAFAEFEDASANALLWNWNLGDGDVSSVQNPTHVYTDPGLFDIILTVTNGDCQDVAFGQVKVEPISTFYAPSAFSPNEDGINETFFGTGESIKEYNMRIIDRWGKLIFESNDPDFHWDGTYLGKPVEVGVYVYDFTILNDYNLTSHHTGHVSLVR